MIDTIIARWGSPSRDRVAYLYRHEQPNPFKQNDTIVTFTYRCFTRGQPAGSGSIQNAGQSNAQAITLTERELAHYLDGGVGHDNQKMSRM
jgi:hypothetical protein